EANRSRGKSSHTHSAVQPATGDHRRDDGADAPSPNLRPVNERGSARPANHNGHVATRRVCTKAILPRAPRAGSGRALESPGRIGTIAHPLAPVGSPSP